MIRVNVDKTLGLIKSAQSVNLAEELLRRYNEVYRDQVYRLCASLYYVHNTVLDTQDTIDYDNLRDQLRSNIRYSSSRRTRKENNAAVVSSLIRNVLNTYQQFNNNVGDAASTVKHKSQ